jgi:DNA-binding transcriptional regulator YhcF (GntR family)
MLQKSVPFYIQIARILRRELQSGIYPVNSKMPDENTLATRFGVSKDVIRVSMRLLGKEGLVKAIRSKGTFVCERPEDERSRFVLLSYHGSLHLDAIRKGIEPVIPSDCDLVLKSNTLGEVEEERQILENIDMASVRALIVAPVYKNEADNTQYYSELVKEGIPLLILDHTLPNLQADEIAFDEYGATQEFMRAALNDIGDNEVVMFTLKNGQGRIRMARNQAMNDIWNDFGTNSSKRRHFEISSNSENHSDEAQKIFEVYLQNNCNMPYVIIHGSPTAWEFYQKVVQHGSANNIKKIYAIGDILRGDVEFNRKLFCYYRLFDDFTPLIKDVLNARLNNPEPPSTPIRHALHYKYMDYEQACNYFIAKMLYQK